MDVKDYKKFFNNKYKQAYNKIQDKYRAAEGAIDQEYHAENRRIDANAYKSKNDVSASSAINLANARNTLLEKGLERSGDSVNTEIRSALSKSRALADIDTEANRAREENALSRMKEKSSLVSRRLEEEGALEKDLLDKMVNQYNLDREYDRQVNESAEDKRRWEIENEQKTAQDQRDYELEMDKFKEEQDNNKFEREFKEKQFEEQVDQNDFNNYMAEKKYYLSENSANSSENSSENSSKDEEKTTKTNDGFTPDIDPERLLKLAYSSNAYKTDSERLNAVIRVVNSLLNDTTLSTEYKNLLRITAFSMGYIGRPYSSK